MELYIKSWIFQGGGEEAGTIRNMAIRYIKEVKNGVVEGKPTMRWKLAGVDKNSANYKKAARLLREGKLKTHDSADGKYKNIASIREEELQ